jgi:hypothetical protein
MMEAARTSETLVKFYQTTGRYNPKDSHLRGFSLDGQFKFTHPVGVVYGLYNILIFSLQNS